MKLDNTLKEIIAKLMDKYSPGLCSLHSDLPYFHPHVSNLHFNLDCPGLLVWAQAIKSETAIYEKVPIISPVFKLSHALKHASKTSVTSMDLPTVSMLLTTPPTGPSIPLPTQMQMPPMLFPSFFLYPQMPMFMGYRGLAMPYSDTPFTPSAIPLPILLPPPHYY